VLRAKVPFYDKDRYFAPDIEQAMALIKDGALLSALPANCRLSTTR